MPRLVVPSDPTKGRFAAQTIADLPPDGYKDRLIKYIPAESVALYTFTDKSVIAHYGIDSAGNPTLLPPDLWFSILPYGLFLLGLIGTPIYIYNQRLEGQPWHLHAVISSIAFLLWAYTLGGSLFLILQWYDVFVAGIAGPVFTFIAGFFEPKPKP
jgi:hypothetical protein